MASYIQHILDKRPDAMRRLYNDTKAEVYTVALHLLSDAQKANTIVCQVYTALFTAFPTDVADEAVLHDRIWKDTLLRCAKQLARADAKAMRVPKDRRFRLPAPTVVPRLPLLDTVLQGLPPYHRILFVARATIELSDEALLAVSKLDARTLPTALKDNRKNVEAILLAAGHGEDFVRASREAVKAVSADGITPETNESVDAVIRVACAEAEATRAAKRRRILWLLGGAVALAALVTVALLGVFGVFGTPDTDPADPSAASDIVDDGINEVADVSATHYATIDIESYGAIRLALDGNLAPKTVENFVGLAESGFYNGLTFHRILEGFMMQGGCPMGNGTGGAGEEIVGEFAENGFDNPIQHTRGAISMARGADYDSASSQFFIVHEDSRDALDGKYAAFGYVIEGMDVVDAICTEARPIDGDGAIAAEAQPVIRSIAIEHVN